jgi:hypothetical protein
MNTEGDGQDEQGRGQEEQNVIQEGKESKRSEKEVSEESNAKHVRVFKVHKAIPVLFCFKQVLSLSPIMVISTAEVQSCDLLPSLDCSARQVTASRVHGYLSNCP